MVKPRAWGHVNSPLKHTLAIYCPVMLNVSVWPQTPGGFWSVSAWTAPHIFVLLWLMHCSFTTLSFSSFFILLSNTAAADMTVSHAISPWRLTFCLSSPPARPRTWRYYSSSNSARTYILSPNGQGWHIPPCLGLSHIWGPCVAFLKKTLALNGCSES